MSNIILNLVVIRSSNLEKSVEFYQMLGLDFSKHRHGKGVEHFVSQIGQITFEIYPQKKQTELKEKMRIGFQVMNLESLIKDLKEQGVLPIVQPTKSEWGIRSVIADPDGHKVELTQIL